MGLCPKIHETEVGTPKSKPTERLALGSPPAYARAAWFARRPGTSLNGMASLTRSARLLRTLIVATCVFPLVQACGRSEPGDYLYNSDGTISVAASSNTGGDSVTTGGTRNTTGGANGRGGSGTGGTRVNPGGGTSVGTGGSTTPGGGRSTVGGSSGQAGSGQGGSGVAGSPSAGTGAGGQPGNPITCGQSVCNSSTQSCCVGLAGATCIGKGQMCGGAVLGCTLNSDCPGNDICCIALTGDISAASSCKARCDNQGSGRDRQLCQTDDECQPPFRFCTATIFGVSVCTRRP